MNSSGLSLPKHPAFDAQPVAAATVDDIADKTLKVPPPVAVSERESCADLLAESTRRNPAKVAFCGPRGRLAYQQLDQLSQSLAAFFRHQLGLRPGERIALLQPHDIGLPVTIFAAWRAGLVVVPLGDKLDTRELIDRLQACDANTVIVHEHLLARLEKIIYDTRISQVIVAHDSDVSRRPNARVGRALRSFGLDRRDRRKLPDAIELRCALRRGAQLQWQAPLLHGDDPAMLQFSAGSDDAPKAVMLSHRNLLASARHFARTLQRDPALREADCLLVRPPLRAPEIPCGWLATMLRGARVVIARSGLQGLRRSLARQRCGLLLAPASTYRELLSQPHLQADLGALQLCISYGASLEPGLRETWRASCQVPLVNAYVSAECAGIACLESADMPGNLGRSLGDLEISVRSPLGDPLPHGEAGELWLRGAQITHGYWGDRAASGRALCGDGWLRSGDLVRQCSDGSLDWLARDRDVLHNCHGDAYPDEVEAVLQQHPLVRQAACVRCALARDLSAFRAAVVTKQDQPVSEHELIDWCRERLPAFAVPVSVTLRTYLPRSPSGEILRRELLEGVPADA